MSNLPEEGEWERQYKREVENHIKQHGLQGIEKVLMAKFEEWKKVKINFGITGDSGAGKSSFINAIRG
jgi:predicted GTPase